MPPGYPLTSLLALESEGCPHPSCNEIKPRTQPHHQELNTGQLQEQIYAFTVGEPDLLILNWVVESGYGGCHKPPDNSSVSS